jgi:8-amino-7-oxononanoate synthase
VAAGRHTVSVVRPPTRDEAGALKFPAEGADMTLFVDRRCPRHGARSRYPSLTCTASRPRREAIATTDLFAKTRAHGRFELVERARREDVLPYFRVFERQEGASAVVEGREVLMFGSNDYLGLASDRRVKEAACGAVESYGTALGGRVLNGTTALHRELEGELADWLDTEEALVFSTGYQANLGCLSALLGPGDTVVSDSENHASIVDGAVLSQARLRPFRHGRLDRLDAQLARAQPAPGGVLVVIDGVFSMSGAVADLPRIVALCRRHGARLMVDEAHAVGVLGASGAGASELLGVEGDVDLRMGSFGKALGSAGGFVAGSREVVDFLRFNSRSLMFTTSSVPAALGAALQAVRICRSSEGPELFARVLENARYLHRGLAERGLSVVAPTRRADRSEVVTPIVPVIVGDEHLALRTWRALLDAGVFCNVALHPAVARCSALLRLSVRAAHRRDHLDRALAALADVDARLGGTLRLGAAGLSPVISLTPCHAAGPDDRAVA